jgi:ketosteroid isomerase-like protein
MRIATALGWALLMVCQGGTPEAKEVDQPIEHAFEHFIDAFNRLEWTAFRGSFAADASLFNPDIPEAPSLHRLDGSDSVDATFRRVFDAIRREGSGPNIVPRDVRVQQVSDAAIVTFEFDRPSGFGRRTLVFARQADGWKIIHVHASNIDQP